MKRASSSSSTTPTRACAGGCARCRAARRSRRRWPWRWPCPSSWPDCPPRRPAWSPSCWTRVSAPSIPPLWTLSRRRWRTWPRAATAWSAWSPMWRRWPNASRSGSNCPRTPAARPRWSGCEFLSYPVAILGPAGSRTRMRVTMQAEPQAQVYRPGVRVYIDAWDPGYGSGMEISDGGPTGETKADVRLDVEVPTDNWRPISPPPDLRAPSSVLFRDGVRRIDSNLWVEEADGTVLPGIAASYAAGVVRCDLRRGSADVVSNVVQRGLFTSSTGARGLSCGITRYEV